MNQSENSWEELIPLIGKDANAGNNQNVIFKYFSRGLASDGQEWIYDFNKKSLEKKILFLVKQYEAQRLKGSTYNSVKWPRELERRLKENKEIKFDTDKISTALLKPFVMVFAYLEEDIISHKYEWLDFAKNQNLCLSLNAPGANKPFHILSSKYLVDLHFTGDSQCIPLYRYNKEGQQQDNITDWALQLFNDHYHQNEPASPVCYAGSSELRDEFKIAIPPQNTITKEAIFQYIYAVLHHPAYRKKYELNLKREFPRIPLYDNFHQWAAWGKRLMDLHINYEAATPYPLERTDILIEPKAGVNSDNFFKPKLKADKETGTIAIGAFTTLSNIPAIAWNYKLGNRSALERILDQYKEKKPSDPTIAEHFNSYHFHDYKEHVINLLQRVCTVSVETMKIIEQMP